MDFTAFVNRVNPKSAKTYSSIYNIHLKRFENEDGVIPYDNANEIDMYIATTNKSINTKKGIYSLLTNLSDDTEHKKQWKKNKMYMETNITKDNMSRPFDKPKKNQIIEFMNYQYKTLNWYGYVINFLYTFHDVSNMDIEFILPRQKTTASTYIIVRKLDCILYINNEKKNIKSQKFLYSCRMLMEQNIYHLSNENVCEHTLNHMQIQ